MEKLEHMVLNYQNYLDVQKKISAHLKQFSWQVMASKYDAVLQKMKK